jgi:hypothetical protein
VKVPARATANVVKATRSAEKPIPEDGPSSTHEAEHTEAEVETTFPVQGEDDS